MQVLATRRKVILGSVLWSGGVRNKPLDEGRIGAAAGLNSSRDFSPIHWQEAKGIFREK